MFQAKWKSDYIEQQREYLEDLDLAIQSRVVEEVNKGFDTRDEMREVFLEIAEEYNVSSDVIWKIYYQGDWL